MNALEAWVREVAAPYGPVDGVTVAFRESGALLAYAGRTVVKVHPDGTDAGDLAARLAVAAGLGTVCVAPLDLRPQALPEATGLGGSVATLWPRVEVLDPDVPVMPWADAAALLAALHRAPAPAGADVLPAAWPQRLLHVLGRLRRGTDGGAPRVVIGAGEALVVDIVRSEPGPAVLTHGDWHLGQLGRAPGGWRLIDVDDLSLADAAWDLARPAGFWAAGILADDDWATFLAAYRAAGGPAVPAEGDPWPRLDLPARAAVVVAAARALLRVGRDGWDDAAEALVATCLRMPRTSSVR